MFQGKKVLITGGLGFIGSSLARCLVDQGAEVTLVDSLIPEYGGNLFNIQGLEARLRVNVSDVRDAHSLRCLVAGQDYLFNLAGQTSHMDSMADPFADLDINVRAQLSILETCRRHNPTVKIVYASTRQIYGRPDYLPVDERHLLRPVDVNGVHKMAGERHHLLYHQVYGLRSCALRLTNTYGPRMRVRDARQTFLGVWIRSLVSGQPFEVWGGRQLRDFTYVDDVVRALMLAAASDALNGGAFNLGGSEVLSLQALADLLVEVNGGGSYRVVPFPAERERIDVGDFYSDYGQMTSAVNWVPRVGLREGLAQTLAYYREHGSRYWEE